MGGQARIKQVVDSSPTIGNLAEPGVCTSASAEERKITRGELMRSAEDRARRGEDRPDLTSTELWGEAIKQVAKGWLEGPFEYHQGAKLRVGDKLLEVSPAYGSGVRQGQKPRAVDDLKRSATYDATAIHTPIDLPSWDHIA